MASRSRDMRYGRRGGRWADADDESGVDALHRIRLSGIDQWPWGDPDPDTGHGLSWWLARAAQAERRLQRRQPLSPVDLRAVAVRDAYRRTKRFRTGADHRYQDTVA